MSAVESPRLNSTQVKALLGLLAKGRPIKNKELKEVAGVELDGKNSARLAELGFVTVEQRRPLIHQLTDDGKRFAATLTAEVAPPKPPSTKEHSGLTPNQILAVVVLMAEARRLSNTEFSKLSGFSLTGTDNAALEKVGLVETDRSKRPYSHQLTDKGWHTVRTLHTTLPPAEGGSATQSMFTLLANINRSLERLQISSAEFFKQASSVQAVMTGDDVEGSIRAAYRQLADKPGSWIGLADLRDRLSGLARDTVDDALRSMVRQPGVRIIPVANSKALTPRDRAAAVRIGDEDNHTILIKMP